MNFKKWLETGDLNGYWATNDLKNNNEPDEGPPYRPPVLPYSKIDKDFGKKKKIKNIKDPTIKIILNGNR